MSKPVCSLPKSQTLSYRLLLLTALSGEYPVESVSRLPGGHAYNSTIMTTLKKKKLLRSFSRDGLLGLRLTASCKKLFLEEWPDALSPFLTGVSETNRPKCEAARRARLHRMAEVLTLMANANVVFTPWEKPSFFRTRHNLPPNTLPLPVYYTCKEVKEIGAPAKKFTSSRFTGILFTDGGIYIVYNTRNGEVVWEARSEERLRATVFAEVSQNLLRADYVNAEINCIIFGRDMAAMPVLMAAKDGCKRNYFVLDSSYPHFYFLPDDRKGEDMLRLLYDNTLRIRFNSVLQEGLQPSTADFLTENDAIDENGDPVLFAYLCDMPRIQRFCNGLNIHGRTGTMICFDFQESAMRQVCGNRVAIQTVNFQRFKEAFLSTEESGSV